MGVHGGWARERCCDWNGGCFGVVMPSGEGCKCHLTGKRRVCKILSLELCTTVNFEKSFDGYECAWWMGERAVL